MGTFYTIQTIEAYQELQEKGYILGTKRYIWFDFLIPYKWMIEQMKKRINEDITEGEYPVWGSEKNGI